MAGQGRQSKIIFGENCAVCQKYLFTREMASFVENRCVGRVYILVLVLGLQWQLLHLSMIHLCRFVRCHHSHSRSLII